MNGDRDPNQPSGQPQSEDLSASAAREVSRESLSALVERMTLEDVRVINWQGRTPPVTPGNVARVEANLRPARMRIELPSVALWFEHSVQCYGDDGKIVASIETGVVLDFKMTGDKQPELAEVSCFADTNGAFIAWPYLREAVQSMSVRLGLAPITLDILRRDEDAYSSSD